MSKVQKTENILEVEEGLEVIEELVGIHSANPFTPNNSSSRSVMYSNMLAQSITPNEGSGDENIIQSGLDKQFGDNTFSKKFENDSMILGVVKRYSGIDIHTCSKTVALVVFYEDMVTREVDYIEVPDYFTLHQYFGFKYKWNKDLIENMSYDSFVPAGTVIADSPAVKENKGYAYGLNTNIAYLSLPEISEDGVIVSESYAKRFNFSIFETRVIEFGETSFPLNLYGDEDNYKPFPDIGEKVKDDGLLMAVRGYDDVNTMALTSKNDVKDFDPMFDMCSYVKKGSGKVVDIVAYMSPKFKKNIYTNTDNGVMKYVNGLTKYYGDIVDLYEKLEKSHYAKTRNYNMPISDKLQRLMVDAYMKSNRVSNNTKLIHKRSKLDIFRIEITVQIDMQLNPAFKLTTLAASKGVIVEIRPDDEMPYNPLTNTRADMVMDPTSIPGRMNIGNLYEQHFNMMSRRVKQLVTEEVARIGTEVGYMEDDVVNKLWEIPLGLLEIIGTGQYDSYLNASMSDKRKILQEIIDKEFFIYYTISSKRKPYQVVNDVNGTIYEPIKAHVEWVSNGKKVISKDEIYIGPQYIILLSKIADDFLSCPTHMINHFGFPIAVGGKQKNMYPWKISPVKMLSETEARLYASYVGPEALAEIKDRANSIPTHMEIYNNILNAKKPTNIKSLVDRTKVPYGNDSAIIFLNNILNPSGVKLEYVKDKTKDHPA